MSITERMSAIHIDSTKANNRADGSSAGNAWRDWEELTRRLGRGTALFRQPTTITVHGALNSSDYLNIKAAVAGTGNLKIVGDRGTAVLTGTVTAKSDFASGTQVQQITGTGLGSHVDKQVEIAASGTPSHVGAVANIAKVVSGDNVRTSTFMVPVTDGTQPASLLGAAVAPSVGDSFAVYSLPTASVGTVDIEPASNINSTSAGATGGFGVLQNLWLRGDTSASSSYASSVRLSAWRCSIAACRLDHIGIVAHDAETIWQASHAANLWMSGGQSLHFMTLFKNSGTHGTQLLRGHYMDIQQCHAQGGAVSTSVMPYCYNGSSMVIYSASVYDSAVGAGIQTHRSAAMVLIENDLWGGGHVNYGVLLVTGSRMHKLSGGTVTLTGPSGDIGRRGAAGVIVGVHSWSDSPFMDAWGTGIVEGQ